MPGDAVLGSEARILDRAERGNTRTVPRHPKMFKVLKDITFSHLSALTIFPRHDRLRRAGLPISRLTQNGGGFIVCPDSGGLWTVGEGWLPGGFFHFA
jgi:hypothetical protein